MHTQATPAAQALTNQAAGARSLNAAARQLEAMFDNELQLPFALAFQLEAINRLLASGAAANEAADLLGTTITALLASRTSIQEKRRHIAQQVVDVCDALPGDCIELSEQVDPLEDLFDTAMQPFIAVEATIGEACEALRQGYTGTAVMRLTPLENRLRNATAALDAEHNAIAGYLRNAASCLPLAQ